MIADVQIADHRSLNSLEAMAGALLDRAPARFALAGHSMGGRVALEVMRLAPERVVRLALLDTGYKPLPAGEAGEIERAGRYALIEAARRKGMRAMALQWVQRMVHPRRLDETLLIDSILDMIARKTPDIFAAQQKALLERPDAAPVLARIKCPTLVLCGSEDAWSPVSQHEEIAFSIENSSLVVVEDCGHMCTMERPAAISEALLRWMGK
jgi:pimeloyl-ACP methyl ester carboxylesterase